MPYDIRGAIFDESRRVISEEKKRNPYFKDDNYIILLGHKIYDYLINDIRVYADSDRYFKTLMGIRCAIDYSEPYTIELFECKKCIDFRYVLTSII